MEELFATTLTNLGYADAYFLWPDEVAHRFRALVRASTQQNPVWTAEFLRWLRIGTPMRYAALVGAAHFVGERLAGGDHGMSRQVVGSVLRHAEDPGHLLAYWMTTFGPRFPKPVKRGVADAVEKLYAQPAAPFEVHKIPGGVPKFNRGRVPRPVGFHDVIRLTHPVIGDVPRMVSKPRPGRAELRNADWDQVIAGMAMPDLLRELRRFDAAGIPFENAMTVARRITDPTEIRRSGVGPLRYLAAWQAVGAQRWRAPLAAGAATSVTSSRRLAGRTLILIDPRTVEGVVFGLALAQSCASVDIVASTGKPFDRIPGESPLHSLIRWQAASFDYPPRQVSLDAYAGHNRVVYVGHPGKLDVPEGVPFYAWQVGEETADERTGKTLEFYGVCDEALAAIAWIEAANLGKWPWDRESSR